MQQSGSLPGLEALICQALDFMFPNLPPAMGEYVLDMLTDEHGVGRLAESQEWLSAQDTQRRGTLDYVEKVPYSMQMDTFVWNSEVPNERTCQFGRGDINGRKCGDTRKCVVCSAIRCHAQYGDYTEIHRASEVLLRYIDTKLESFTEDQDKNADIIFEYLKDRPVERKAISHYGAVRLQRAEVQAILNGQDSLNNFWVIATMIPGIKEQGYVYAMYQDQGNAIYSNYFNERKFVNGREFSQEKKGDLIECVLALGWLYLRMVNHQKEKYAFIKKMVPWFEQGISDYKSSYGRVAPCLPAAQAAAGEESQESGGAAASAGPGPMDIDKEQAVPSEGIKKLAEDVKELKEAAGRIEALIVQQIDIVKNMQVAGTKKGTDYAEETWSNEAKGTTNIPEFSKQEKDMVDVFTETNNKGCWLEKPGLLEVGAPEEGFNVILKKIQSLAYNLLKNGYKDYHMVDGWYGWLDVLHYVKADHEVKGLATEELLMQVLIHTIDDWDPSHATYMVRKVSYPNPEDQEKMYDFVIVKLRENPNRTKRGGGKGGGWSYPPQKRGNWTR